MARPPVASSRRRVPRRRSTTRTATNTSRRPDFTEILLVAPLVLGLAVGGGRADRARPGIHCALTVAPEIPAGRPVEVRFTLKNGGARALKVLRWYTPFEGLRGDIFTVTRGARRIEYEGPLMKRGDPSAGDYVEVPAGESVSAVVDASQGYDFSRAGTYRISFARGLSDVAEAGEKVPRSRDQHRPMKLPCGPVRLRITSK
ncbi:MAG TPA: protease [Thermoanaerobaculia bacterium]